MSEAPMCPGTFEHVPRFWAQSGRYCKAQCPICRAAQDAVVLGLMAKIRYHEVPKMKERAT